MATENLKRLAERHQNDKGVFHNVDVTSRGALARAFLIQQKLLDSPYHADSDAWMRELTALDASVKE